MNTRVERRQFRRAEIDVPVAIRALDQDSTAPELEPAITGQVKNLSLAGVYCYTKSPCSLTTGKRIVCTVTIPPEQTRAFPFTRVTGKGWVVRVESIPTGRRAGENPTDEELVGLAVAFTPDVTALGTIIH